MPKSTTFLQHGTNFYGVFGQLSDYLKKSAKFASVNKTKRIMVLNGILGFLNLGTGEVILIVAIILLLFGGRKIPELMRGLGKGVKSFKQGMNEVEEELKKPIEDLDGKKEKE